MKLLKSKEGTHSMQTLIDTLDIEDVNVWFSSFSE